MELDSQGFRKFLPGRASEDFFFKGASEDLSDCREPMELENVIRGSSNCLDNKQVLHG